MSQEGSNETETAVALAVPEQLGKQPPASLITRTGQYGIVRLTVRDFDALTPKERALAHHLANAARAGRDITWDQRHRLSLPLRNALERAWVTGRNAPAEFRTRLLNTLRKLWIGNGPYDSRSGQKIPMEFTRQQWDAATDTSKNTAGPQVDDKLRALMFDRTVDGRLIGRDGRHPISGSGANFYKNVTSANLKGFTERYPLNSRLVKIDDRLFEEVYRTGRDLQSGKRPAPIGRYAKELSAVVTELGFAQRLAKPKQAEQIRHLINYFETGDPADFEHFNIAWLDGSSPIDMMIGFIETDDDSRGVKGTYEGIVFMADAKVQRLINGLREQALYFETSMPWADEYKRPDPALPAHEAWQVISAHGDAGPDIPLGINLPNIDRIRREVGSRSLLFTNVIRATDEVTESILIDEFALIQERTDARKCTADNSDLMLALHEIVGHGTGQTSSRLENKSPDLFLKEFSTALEEARAELVALHLLWDPKVRTLYPGYDDLCAEAALRGLARRDLTMLRRVRGERIEDDHMRATHLIISYAASQNAVQLKQENGRTYQYVRSVPKMRAAIKELLIEVMRIRAEGDYDAAKAMLTKYALFFDTAVRDEVRSRAEKLNLPRYFAFVLPELTATNTNQGMAADARMTYGDDFDAQMLGWSSNAPNAVH